MPLTQHPAAVNSSVTNYSSAFQHTYFNYLVRAGVCLKESIIDAIGLFKHDKKLSYRLETGRQQSISLLLSIAVMTYSYL